MTITFTSSLLNIFGSFFFFWVYSLATSSGSFSGEDVFQTRTVPVKPALSAPERASGPLPSVASPEKIPYFRDQLLTGKAGAPCKSIGLATINYLTYRFPTTVSHSPRLTPVRQGKPYNFSEGKIPRKIPPQTAGAQGSFPAKEKLRKKSE